MAGEAIKNLAKLKRIIDNYMSEISGLSEHCDRCLNTMRWGRNVVLMVLDAAFTSIGLNYFTAVIPKVEEFRDEFVKKGKLRSLRELSEANVAELQSVWKNRRSWNVAKSVAAYLATVNGDDREALRAWADAARPERWREDPIGSIKGVGLITLQYLRMMGGVDTVMPDKIVKRVVNDALIRAGLKPVNEDLAFIKCAEELARKCGYRPIELCWMTWMIQKEGGKTRAEKYGSLLWKI